MKYFKYSLSVVLSLFLLCDVMAQDNADLVGSAVSFDVDKIENQSNVNTPDLEFSPAFYGNSIVYVSSSKSKKKFDLKIGESFFTLKVGIVDSLGNIQEPYSFLDELDIPNHAGPCAFSSNGELMFLSRNKKGFEDTEEQGKVVNPIGIYLYKYWGNSWQKEEDFPFNNPNYKVFHPTWDEENNRLIFASDMPGGYGGTDLYSVNYVDGKWTGLKNMGPTVNTEYNEAFPFIYNSKYLFFASNRDGGKGGYDIYFSQENNNFDDVQSLGDEINSEGDDFGLILSEDATTAYFNSSRLGGKGKDDLYKIMFSKPVIQEKVDDDDYFSIKIKNANTGLAVENAEITFSKYKITTNKNPQIKKINGIDKEIIYAIDPNSVEESTPMYSNHKGEKMVNLPEGSYILKVKKSGYSEYNQLVNTSDLIANDIVVAMKPYVYDVFEITFVDENNKIEEGVILKSKDSDGKKMMVEGNNPYVFKVLRGTNLHIVASKEGFVDKSLDIVYGTTPAKFDAVMQRKAKKIEYVEHLPVDKGQILVLSDIIYEYNSDKLTKNSKIELDKLVSHLKTHKNLVVELGSHSDSRGRASYNLALSKKRSASAKKYIVSKGVDASRIKVKGYGETMIKNHCINGVKCSEKEHAINRRTEVKVLEN